MTKKTAKRPTKKPAVAPSVPSDDLVRDLLEAGAELERRVTELEVKVATLEHRELMRQAGPNAKFNFSTQIPVN